MNIKSELLREKIKEALAVSIHENCPKVTEILFTCIGLLGYEGGGMVESSVKNRHSWTKSDYIVAFYLAKKYNNSSFLDDTITKQWLEQHPSLTSGSLKMAIQNLYFLMGKKKGLSSASNLARKVYEEHENTTQPELVNIIEKLMQKTKEENKFPSVEIQEIKKVKRRIPRWFNNPGQFNSIVLINYLELNTKRKEKNILVSELRDKCATIKTFNFYLHFSQMKNIAPRNHGKVFNVQDDSISLWPPVKEFILSEYNKSCK